MAEQTINPLAETQRIEINQEPEGIKQIQDGNDLTFWLSKIEEEDNNGNTYQLEIVRGINQNPKLADFLRNTQLPLSLETLKSFVSIVERSQNKDVRIEVGKIISDAHNKQSDSKHGIK